jgi:hypothetical protein
MLGLTGYNASRFDLLYVLDVLDVYEVGGRGELVHGFGYVLCVCVCVCVLFLFFIFLFSFF